MERIRELDDVVITTDREDLGSQWNRELLGWLVGRCACRADASSADDRVAGVDSRQFIDQRERRRERPDLDNRRRGARSIRDDRHARAVCDRIVRLDVQHDPRARVDVLDDTLGGTRRTITLERGAPRGDDAHTRDRHVEGVDDELR